MLVFLFIFLLFANYLQMMVGEVKYYDEAITLIGLFLIIYYRNEWKELERDYRKMMLCLFPVLAIGIISTIRYHIQPQFAGIWRDFLAVSKFPICYYAYSLYARHVNLQKIMKKIIPIVKAFTLICFGFGITIFVARSPFNGILYHGERYGFPIFDMGFSHNTFLIAVLLMNIAVLIADGSKKNALYVLLGVACVLFTMRSKPMLVLVFLATVLFVRRRFSFRFTKKNIVAYTFFILILTYLAAANQIDRYVGYGESAARGACYFYGAIIANNLFPLGAGFCTFSSSLSGVYYSPLYYEFKLENIEGLMPDNFTYAADTFWPNIFSQYGWIGFFFYIMMLYFMVKTIHKRFLPLSDQWIAGMLIIVYSISAAFAEAIFTNATAVDFALILTLFIGENNEYRPTNSFSFFRRRRKIYSGS